MEIKCPHCSHQGRVDPEKIPPQGANAKCPRCRESFPVRGSGSSRSADPGPASPATPPGLHPPETKTPLLLPHPAAAEPSGASSDPSAVSGVALGFKDGSPSASPEEKAPPGGGGLGFKDSTPSQMEIRTAACTGCLKLFNENELTEVDDRKLCQSCRDAFREKGQTPMRGRSATPAFRPAATKRDRFQYGGFWIRAGAYLVDVFLLFLLWQFVLSPIFMKVAMNMFAETAMPAAMSFPQNSGTMSPAEMDAAMAQMQGTMNAMAGRMIFMAWIVNLIGILVMGGYFVILEGGTGYTLGKKALGLRVVTPEGDLIGYLKAFARYVGKIISGFILCIGFIMAAFDDEKRTLHDRMVNSRVVRE